jgi:hypothetical protein
MVVFVFETTINLDTLKYKESTFALFIEYTVCNKWFK